MIRFRFFLPILLHKSFFRVSLVPFSWFIEDLSNFSVYPKLAKSLKLTSVSKLEAIWKLPVIGQVVTNLLILLIKLIASLPKPLGFKCNPPLLSSFEVIFPLSMILICKPCKCSFVLITLKEAMPLSVLVIKLEMTKLLSDKVCSVSFFRWSNLSITILDGSLTVLLVSTYNIISSGQFFKSGLIQSYVSSIVAPGKFLILTVLSLLEIPLSSMQGNTESPTIRGVFLSHLWTFSFDLGFLVYVNFFCCFFWNSVSSFSIVIIDLFSISWCCCNSSFWCSSLCVWFSGISLYVISSTVKLFLPCYLAVALIWIGWVLVFL